MSQSMPKEASVNEIQNKVNELIALLNGLVRQSDEAIKSAKSAEEKRDGYLKEIESLEKRISSLRDTNSIENQRLKDAQNEAEYLTNVAKGKISNAEIQADAALALQESLIRDRQDLNKTIADYNALNADINRRQNEAEALMVKAQDGIKELDERLASTNIEEREAQASRVMDKAKILREEAKNAQELANNTLAEANAIREQAAKAAFENDSLKARFETRLNEVEVQARALDAEKSAVEKQKQDLQGQELRINKIIKEKNIEALLVNT